MEKARLFLKFLGTRRNEGLDQTDILYQCQ